MTEEEERERIERCKRDNPDLPESFIISALKALDELDAGLVEPFSFDDDDEENESKS